MTEAEQKISTPDGKKPHFKGTYPSDLLDDKRFEFLAHVASLYYEEQLTQSEISEKLEYSRSAISRFLTEARETGVVEIRINHPLHRNSQLEKEVRKRFELADVRILQRRGLSYPRMLSRLGQLTARMIDEMIDGHTILGISTGTAIYEVANAIYPTPSPGVKVIQLMGSLGSSDPQIDGPELAQAFARNYGGTYLTLPAPLIVDTPEIREGIMSDSYVRDLMALAQNIDVAIVGIGSTDVFTSRLILAGHMSREAHAEIVSTEAVGEICAIYYSMEGELLDVPLTQRIIGVGPDVLRAIPTVIGVAGGQDKAAAICGALHSGLINVIVTDDVTALDILKLKDDVEQARSRDNPHDSFDGEKKT